MNFNQANSQQVVNQQANFNLANQVPNQQANQQANQQPTQPGNNQQPNRPIKCVLKLPNVSYNFVDEVLGWSEFQAQIADVLAQTAGVGTDRIRINKVNRLGT
jgi:hypothetical protein